MEKFLENEKSNFALCVVLLVSFVFIGCFNSEKRSNRVSTNISKTKSSRVNIAKDWSIGFNEPFIQQYLEGKSVSCEFCPDVVNDRSYSMIQSRLFDLATHQHVGTFREVIPLSLLAPHFADHINSDSTYYDLMTDIVEIYANYNLYLIIAPGRPLPGWMLYLGKEEPDPISEWLVMPQTEPRWSELKNRITWSFVNFIKHLKESGRISNDWIKTHLFIEGFNEFDDLSDKNDEKILGNPKRAADLQNGIKFALNHHKIFPAGTLMPSYVFTFKGYEEMCKSNGDSDFCNIDDPVNKIVQTGVRYFKEYYTTYGGTGLPNIHLYSDKNTASAQLGYFEYTLKEIVKSVPGITDKVVVSEVGTPEKMVALGCNHGLPKVERDSLYYDIASSKTFLDYAYMTVFWRLMNLNYRTEGLDGDKTCQHFYGVVNHNDSSYNEVGLNLFNYLKNMNY